jgi:hypothetical protein
MTTLRTWLDRRRWLSVRCEMCGLRRGVADPDICKTPHMVGLRAGKATAHLYADRAKGRRLEPRPWEATP